MKTLHRIGRVQKSSSLAHSFMQTLRRTAAAAIAMSLFATGVQADLVRTADVTGAWLYTNSSAFTPGLDNVTPAVTSAYRQNLAYGRTALQSTVSTWGVAANAVDGNLTNGNFCHTLSGVNEWLQINYADTATTLSTIAVMNRWDLLANASRLNNFTMSVYNGDPSAATDPAVALWTSEPQASLPDTAPWGSYSVPADVSETSTAGTYMRVTNGITSFVNLCEVRAFSDQSVYFTGKYGDFVENSNQYIASNFVQTSEGSIQFNADFSTTTPTVNQLDVSGTFTAGGELIINLGDDLTNLTPTSTLQLVNASSYAGSFSKITTTGASTNYAFMYKDGTLRASAYVWDETKNGGEFSTITNWLSDPTGQMAMFGTANSSAVMTGSLTLSNLNIGVNTDSVGTLAVNTGANLEVADTLTLGTPGTGNINQADGTVSAGAITLNGNSTAQSSYTMTGGTLNVGSGMITAAGTNYKVELGSGTVNFTESGTEAIDTTLTGTTTMNVADGKTVTWSGVLSGAGGLTKTGTGTLELAKLNTFTGNLSVDGGLVTANVTGGETGTINRNASISINNGGTFRINVSDGLGYIAGNPAMINVNEGGTFTINTGFHASVGSFTLQSGTITSVGAGSTTGNYIFDKPISVLADTNGPSVISAQKVLLRNSGTFNVAEGGRLNVSSILTGTATLTKDGSGVLQLSGANTYSGGTVVNAGVLELGGTNNGYSAIGTGTLTINAGTEVKAVARNPFGGKSQTTLPTIIINGGTLTPFEYFHVDDITLNSGTIASHGTTGDGLDFYDRESTITSTGTSSIASKVTTSSTLIYDVTDGKLTQSGVITSSNTSGIVKNGAGTLLLNAANTYTGGTTVNAGVLELGGTNTGKSAIGSGPLTINAGAEVKAVAHNPLSYAGGSVSPPTIIINGGTLTPYEFIHVDDITLNSGTIASHGTTGSGLDFNARESTITSTGTSSIASKVTTISPLTYDVTDGELTQSGDLIANTGTGGIIKTGAGTLTITGGTSAKTVAVNGGILNTGGINNLETITIDGGTWNNSGQNSISGAAAISFGIGGGTLNLTAGNPHFTNGAPVITVAANAADAAITGNLLNTNSKNVEFNIGDASELTVSTRLVNGPGITKTGTGTLVMSNPVASDGNQYKSLTIEAGTVKFTPGGTLSSGPIVVNGGILDLTESDKGLSINSLTIGNSGIINVDVVKNADGTFTCLEPFDLSGANATLGGTLNVLLTGELITYADLNKVADVFTNYDTITGDFSAISLLAGSNVLPSEMRLVFNAEAGQVGFGVPEPATWLMLVLGTVTLVLWRKRR